MSKKVFILNGHPGSKSFCSALSEQYLNSAKSAGHETRILNLSEMQFNMDMRDGYADDIPLEHCVTEFQDALKWCDHFVIVHPLWWGGMPAKLKGLFDRGLLPGQAFIYKEGSPFPKGLLANRTAQVIVTADTPPWYLYLIYRTGGLRAMKTQILQFVGFSSIKFKVIGPVRTSDEKTRKSWLAQMQKLAA